MLPVRIGIVTCESASGIPLVREDLPLSICAECLTETLETLVSSTIKKTRHED